MTEYITFERFNTIAGQNPDFGAEWLALPEEDRLRYYNWIHNQLETHPWLGIPLGTPGQVAQFPRRVGQCLLRWDTDLNRDHDHAQWMGHETVWPSSLIAHAAITLFSRREQRDLQTQIDMGVRKAKVGPLEVEIVGGVNGTPQPETTPLPEPLWSRVKEWSLLYRRTTSPTGPIKVVKG